MSTPRVKITDPSWPNDGGDRKHELHIVTYESPDGKTRHTQAVGLDDELLDELALAALARLLDHDYDLISFLDRLPPSKGETRVAEVLDAPVPGPGDPQEYSLADPEGA